MLSFQLEKSIAASIGLVGKYNTKTSKPNGGVGATIEAGPISASYTRVRDDGKPDDGAVINYYTNTFSAGFKILNIAVDWTYIKNNTTTKTYAKILSASVFFKKVMATWGTRTESHGHPTVIFYDEFGAFTDPDDTEAKHSFLGLQYMFKKRFIFGVYKNYYLNNDFSLGLSAFFQRENYERFENVVKGLFRKS